MNFSPTSLVLPKTIRWLLVLIFSLTACSRQIDLPRQTPESSPATTESIVTPTGAATAPSATPELTDTGGSTACQPVIDISPGFGEWAQITAENVSRLEPWMSLDLPGVEFLFSSSLTYLAILMESQVQIFDLENSRLLRCLPLDETIAREEFQFAFSADEKTFVWTPRKGRVELQFELQGVTQGEALGSMAVAEMCCERVSLSPDGRYVAIDAYWESDEILLWDVVADEVYPLEGRGLVFSPDGGLAAVSSYFENEQLHQVSLWDLAVRQIIYSEQNAFDPKFSPDGSELSYQRWIDQPEVVVIDVKTHEPVRNLTGFETAAPIFIATFSPDRQTLVWESRGGLRLMNVAAGQLGPALPYHLLAFSPDSQLLAVAHTGYAISDQKGMVWLLDSQSGEVEFSFDLGDDLFERPLGFSADSQMLAVLDSDDGLIRFWGLSTGAEVHALSGSDDPIVGFEFARSNQVLNVWTASGTVVLWAIPP